MALNIVLVDGIKQADGSYAAPAKENLNDDSIRFKMADGKLTITGLDPDTDIPTGRYFAVYYDEDSHKFLGQLAGVDGFKTTVSDDSHPQGLNLSPNDNGATITK